MSRFDNLTTNEQGDLINAIQEHHFLIRKRGIWYAAGGAVAFLVLAGVLSWAGSAAGLRSNRAVAAMERAEEAAASAESSQASATEIVNALDDIKQSWENASLSELSVVTLRLGTTEEGGAVWTSTAANAGKLRSGESKRFRICSAHQNARLRVNVAGTHNNHVGAGNWQTHFVQTAYYEQTIEVKSHESIPSGGNGRVTSNLTVVDGIVVLEVTNSESNDGLWDVIIEVSGFADDLAIIEVES